MAVTHCEETRQRFISGSTETMGPPVSERDSYSGDIIENHPVDESSALKIPTMLTSRADTPRTRIASPAVAVLLAHRCARRAAGE